MTGFPSEVDVAVIGAGAAGIGAARRLAEAGARRVLVLEARERVGGRVHTITPAGFPLDRGAEWLHSADRNPLSPIAQSLGFSVHRRPPEWTSRLSRSGQSAEAEADWLATREAQGRARRQAALEPEDRSLASLLPPVAAGTNYSMPAAPGETEPSWNGSRSRTTSATMRAAPMLTGGWVRVTAGCSRNWPRACRWRWKRR